MQIIVRARDSAVIIHILPRVVITHADVSIDAKLLHQMVGEKWLDTMKHLVTLENKRCGVGQEFVDNVNVLLAHTAAAPSPQAMTEILESYLMDATNQ